MRLDGCDCSFSEPYPGLLHDRHADSLAKSEMRIDRIELQIGNHVPSPFRIAPVYLIAESLGHETPLVVDFDLHMEKLFHCYGTIEYDSDVRRASTHTIPQIA